jgi:UDP-N-acetylglucosamine/UDP-N-acetylgalactosamine diphosphorylase
MSKVEEILVSSGQQALLEHLRTLQGEERVAFESEFADLSPTLLNELQAALRATPLPGATRFEPLASLVRGADAEFDQAALKHGQAALRNGRVAALIVAGGQGTRLGLSGPKGKFPAGPVTGASLFSIFARKVLRRSRDAGKAIPLCVMTGPENDAETRAHFAEHAFFGLERSQVHFFVQGTLPAMDDHGQVLLRTKTQLFRSPDGHGGTLRALHDSGLLQRIEQAGIESLFYFQVDNPLVDVCDPWFLGAHSLQASEFSSKAVSKRGPDEKVGVLGRIDGLPGVIEYSDLPSALREERLASGALRFDAGNIAIHVIDVGFVRRLVSGSNKLPLHLARKDIPCIGTDGQLRTCVGIKFETFIFDAMRSARNPLLVMVNREDEFSPIKNRLGDDSPESCRRDQMAQWMRWLAAAGVEFSATLADGSSRAIEISPLTALGPEDLGFLVGRTLPNGDIVL